MTFITLSNSTAEIILGILLVLIVLLLLGVMVYGVIDHIRAVKRGTERKLNLLFLIILFSVAPIVFLFSGIRTDFTFGGSPALAVFFTSIFLYPVLVVMYFAPYLIANGRKHDNETAIFILNLFAGWTIIIWFIAFIWAFISNKRPVARSRVQDLKLLFELLQSGAITQAEYERRKNEILGYNNNPRV